MFKAIDKWLIGYLKSILSRPRCGDGVRHLMVCLCDHFEPFRGGVGRDEARRSVREWTQAYPKVVDGFLDADGCPPRHTFFYPEEEYDEHILDQLAGFCREGYGEVEIHLHHRHDTAGGLRNKLVRFRDLLHERHGLLGVERETTDPRLQTLDLNNKKNIEQKPAKSAKEEGLSPQRHGDAESENSMLREFQARSTTPEIPATPSGGIPGERGDVRHLNPHLSLFAFFKKRYGNYGHGTPWAKCPYSWISRFSASLCLRASVVKSSPLRSSCASVPLSEFSRPAVCDMETNVSFSRIRYGFIHGNWALCNSRPDGDWCGVNEELGILAETGCYADFTFPSVPSATQPRMVNAIYYAKDTPGKPRGADDGVRVGVGGEGQRAKGKGGDGRGWGSGFRVQGSGNRIQNSESGIQNPESSSRDEEVKKQAMRCGKGSADPEPRTLNPAYPLLLITGPLALNWRRRKWGVLPRIENGEITGANPPSEERVRLWVEQQIGVRGRPDWVFVKLHTHGCVPENAGVVLGAAMRKLHETLKREFNDGERWQLHYVTAREAYNLVKAAEAGKSGGPGQWRDYRVGRPAGNGGKIEA